MSSLIKSDLVDEFHLITNPSALGSGLAIFNKISSALNLSLIRAMPYPCGIVVSEYKEKIIARNTEYEIQGGDKSGRNS